MPLGVIGASLSAALLIQATTTDGASGAVYDAIFAPLKRSEAQYARLGPVGPYYPERAARDRIRGGAVLDCLVQDHGRLAQCKAVSEQPAGMAFEEAAAVMARRGLLTVGPDAPVGQVVHVRVMFDPSIPAQVEH